MYIKPFSIIFIIADIQMVESICCLVKDLLADIILVDKELICLGAVKCNLVLSLTQDNDS
jgi:hypothetical protein